MILQDAIKKGGLIKLPQMSHWIRLVVSLLVWDDYELDNYAYLTRESLLSNKWEAKDIINEEWFEGNFKNKFPYGVLCNVYNGKSKPNPDTGSIMTFEGMDINVIFNYHKGDIHPFKSIYWSWERAVPVSTYNAPKIIKREE